ncbi:NADP-dependent phosphogluconate dehydrogenase [Flavihumibacter stibioxidans]|uniref:6-phosphogluconate dehydrogenase, decarboxylating n=1 Tax=Flavihumibacter stibioxidans TaxID=1834163 RepID=A0ABR7MA70_9BACT|nr:NADP-dependent phosphogluconate dehydrogenase [Flavihumibacter stibioxidans]MBC6491952.1 phosphogluconate dehydrogenase (NADP(+)-dependent, decarboxylating) [Flavihumibacter stibioxidans]
MDNLQFDFGMVGLGVMGRNLLLNVADHGFRAIGFDKDPQKTTDFEQSATPGTIVKGVNSLEEMVNSLSVPRRIMILVPAGKPVDDVIESLLPLVSQGDIIIDGGNTYYTDTLRRYQYLQPKGIHFIGIGVSGGEEGARFGPSMMPGGDQTAWEHLKPVLQSIAAKVNGEPCVDYMGKGAAGHFVKMVHNGIEYAIMQLICEVYDLLHRGAGFSNEELHQLFSNWNEAELKSYLIEITAAIFKQQDPETGNQLVDMILDKAGSKGTGKWTSQIAMDMGVAIPTIDMAVTMRNLSALKSERVEAEKLRTARTANPSPAAGQYPLSTDRESLANDCRKALFSAIILSYVQGMAMLQTASKDLDMDIPLHNAVKVWRGGCIIRSTLLETFYTAYQLNPITPNLLLDGTIAELVSDNIGSLRTISSLAALNGFPAGCLMNALTYYDAYTTGRLPLNLLQAQRDYFGAHTYERTDREGKFHTQWT